MHNRYILNDMPPQVPEALLDKARRAETATIGHRRFTGFLDVAIQSLHPLPVATTVAGTAVTLALPGMDSTLLHHIIGELRPGDLLVIDRLGDYRHACLGGGVACAIKARGCVGVLIDGTCTDSAEIAQYQLPVWSRGVSPITTRLYDVGGAFNIDIACGGAVVHPGDLVLCDASGALVMPVADAGDDIDWALEKQAAEPKGHQRLLDGELLGERSGASAKVRAALN